MARATRCGRSFLVAEVVLSAGLTLALMLLTTTAMVQHANARRENDTRRLLRAAIEEHMARVRAGLLELAERPTTQEPLPPGEVAVSAAASPGDGLWEGFRLVTITARKQVTHDRCVIVELSGYVDKGGRAP